MPIRRGQPLTFKAKGLSDTIDGTNAFPGAMLSLQNLVPSPGNAQMFVPRPASLEEYDFSDLTTPGAVTALLLIGTRAYGMIGTASPAGHDQPFCYDIETNTFITISGITLANTPVTPSASGDWQPPHMEMVGQFIIVTHPGFSGGSGPFFGWIDISGFTSNTLTGTTHNATKVIDTLSSSPLTAGFSPGDLITDASGDIPAGTRIASLTATTITLDTAMTGGHAADTLTVTGGTFAAPMWGAGNTNTNPLAAVPKWVSQYRGRAWYAVGNKEVFSDSLAPLQVTNASQALTLGDTTDVTCSGGLPLSNQLGGIVASLIVFKGDAIVFQITGDLSTMDLAVNALNVSVGTQAPNTICSTPLGMAFVAPDGLRIIDFGAKVSDPIGANGSGILIPFQFAIDPSRMCAAFNQNVLRISVKNGTDPNEAVQEYWLDFGSKIWTGPHTFPASVIGAYQAPTGTSSGHGFVLAASGINAKLWTSEASPSIGSSYVENGTQLTWAWQTSLLPDNAQMEGNAIVESAMGFALSPLAQIIVTFANEQNATLDQVTLTGPSGAQTLWGSFIWGEASWGGQAGVYQQYRLSWHKPLVFKQASVRATGSSAFDLVTGNLYLKYQVLGYMLATEGV